MISHNKIPLSKEELFVLLCNLGNQFQSSFAIMEANNSSFPFVYCNEDFSELTGYHQSELLNQTIHILEGIKTDHDVITEIHYYLKKSIAFETTVIHYHKEGFPFWNRMTCQPIYDKNNTVQYILLYCKDITHEMVEKMLLKLEREVFFELDQGGNIREILQLITEKVETFYIRDIRCAIHMKYGNEFKTIASGSLPSNMIQPIEMETSIFHNLTDKTIYIQDLLTEEHLDSNFKQLIQQYGITSCWTKPIFNEEKQILSYFTIYLENNQTLKQTDLDFLNKLSPLISLTIKYIQQKENLQKLAYFDINTGIPNFNYFYTNLKNWIEQDIKGFLLMIQPKEYSNIVDLFGRKFGDHLIQKFIQNLHEKFHNEADIIYGRFSNSSIIIGKNFNHGSIKDTIEQLLDLTTIPYVIAEEEIMITLTIGITYFNPTTSIDESIRQADIALTSAKQQSGNVVSFFSRRIDERIKKELNMLHQLSYGLKNNEFTVHLQPKVSLQTNQVVGFEALARWNSKVLGQVSPAEFIPIAEQAGKIREIDLIILEKVLQWQQTRILKNSPVIPISVNVSPVHFYQDTFIQDFISLVKKYKVQCEHIKIEVTENFKLFDFQRAKQILLELKKYGFESSIDDFGVGFSSLSYLQQLPFSEIKIDRSFVNNIDDKGMGAVVHTIVELASKLNMNVVAEGIETEEQLMTLKNMGCHIGQGYYFHKPIPIEEAEKLLNP